MFHFLQLLLSNQVPTPLLTFYTFVKVVPIKCLPATVKPRVVNYGVIWSTKALYLFPI